MINSYQLKTLVITPVLSKLQLFSDSAVNLLLFTCAAESKGGTYLKQIKGQALGIYQMEPLTHNDIWQNYLRHRPVLLNLLGMHFNVIRMENEDRLITDLAYSTAMARIHYLRVKSPLPDANDVDGLWEYYKAHYNTVAGKAKKEASIKAYQDFLG